MKENQNDTIAPSRVETEKAPTPQTGRISRPLEIEMINILKAIRSEGVFDEDLGFCDVMLARFNYYKSMIMVDGGQSYDTYLETIKTLEQDG